MSFDLRVFFTGICTHVRLADNSPNPNRVVLVNALADETLYDQPIKSHVATLRIAASDIASVDSIVYPGTSDVIVEWKLDGVRMRVENATTSVDYDKSFMDCMPHLADLTSPEVLSPPSTAAVDAGQPERASCIFDVTHGTLYAGANESGAAFGMLVTDTDGGPRVSIRSFATGEISIIQLKRGAEMTLANLGATAEADDRYDFYLHYKLAERMPTKPGIHTDPGPCVANRAGGKTWPPGFKSVGPGCSNSAYP